MSRPDALYDAFTGKGVLPSHWAASGVETSYDPETKDLIFEMPQGWSDRMSDEDRVDRRKLWSEVANPTYNVEYRLCTRISSVDVVTKLVTTEHDDGMIEFRTNIDFNKVDLERGSSISIDLIALAKMVGKDDPKRIVLLRGDVLVPTETLWLSKNTPGFFFVVEGGIILSFHTLQTDKKNTICITHVSFLGRIENVEKL